MKQSLIFLFFILISLPKQSTTQSNTSKNINGALSSYKTITLPWNIKSAFLYTTEEQNFEVTLLGNPESENEWILKNEDEIKEKWGINLLNVEKQDNLEKSRNQMIKYSNNVVIKSKWNFVFKAGKALPDTESAILKFNYVSNNGKEEDHVQFFEMKIFIKK